MAAWNALSNPNGCPAVYWNSDFRNAAKNSINRSILAPETRASRHKISVNAIFFNRLNLCSRGLCVALNVLTLSERQKKLPEAIEWASISAKGFARAEVKQNSRFRFFKIVAVLRFCCSPKKGWRYEPHI